MGFNYEKSLRRQRGEDSMWSSYSDLFMMLSLVFLILYVAASLRSGTDSLHQQMAFQQLEDEAADLREQARVYNTLKNEQLEKSSEKEQETYKKLMAKLTLLQDEARKDKEQLRLKAKQNEEEEFALNQYQQIIRNIINTNVLAKAGLEQRDEIIKEKRQRIALANQLIQDKEQTIVQKQLELREQNAKLSDLESDLSQKSTQIKKLRKSVSSSKQTIKKNKSKIAKYQSQMGKQVKNLDSLRKRQKLSKAKYKERLKNLKSATSRKISKLKSSNTVLQKDFETKTKELSEANDTLKSAAATIEKGNIKLAKLSNDLRQAATGYAEEAQKMREKFEGELAAKQSKFDSELKKEKLSAGDKLKRADEFKKKTELERKALGDKLADLKSKMDEAAKKIKQKDEDQKKFSKYIAALEKEKEELTDDLEKSKDILKSRRDIAKRIRDNFRKAGIKADVDKKSGDVVLSFGKEYFATNKYNLKRSMKKSLKKFFPVYAKSLFTNKAIANKISSVEIIGYSSPTYKGKFVDPSSLAAKDREAVSYNLDLSYKRARSIFTHIFDTKKMKFKYQSKLLPLVKVTGRSYLADEMKGKNLETGLSRQEYCAKFDCQKNRRVIVKFTVKND